MQLLSVLILVHCFDCVSQQKLDNEVKFKMLRSFGSKKNLFLLSANTSIINFIRKCTYDDQEDFSLAKKAIPYSFTFNAMECKYSAELIRRWQIDEIGQCTFCSANSRIQRRKLLIYSDKMLHENSNEQLHKDKQKTTIKKVTKSIESQDEFWDGWGSWSSCSATCGNGHQVRWRHCSRESCTKGLKKAQIKTCRMKKCESKNILRWLGIKSK